MSTVHYTAKEWLLRARKLNLRLNALRESKRQAYDRATAVTTAPKLNFSGTAGYASNDKNAIYAALSAEVDEQIKKLEQIRTETLQMISQVEDNTLAVLLTEYYINDRTWEEVAVAIHYSYQDTVRRKHPKALKKISELLKIDHK